MVAKGYSCGKTPGWTAKRDLTTWSLGSQTLVAHATVQDGRLDVEKHIEQGQRNNGRTEYAQAVMVEVAEELD